VASFAWDRPVAAVDTNVRRVIGRWDGVAHAPAATARRAGEWLARDRPAEFNQAMMELGATVCRPRGAACGECPLRPGCATAAAGGPQPAPARRRPPERFEATDRWARGRVVAAVLSGEPLPAALRGERLERVVAGLERDGLIARGADGSPVAPG
jgi:A/G-specific adenine glycosylase